MCLFRIFMLGVIVGIVTPTFAIAGGPCFDSPISYGPVYGPPISYCPPVVSSSYVEPVHEQVIIKEHIREVVAPVAVPVVVPATVFQYLPALSPAAQVTSNVSVAAQGTATLPASPQVAVQQAGSQVAVAAQTPQVAATTTQTTAVAAQPATPIVQQQHVQTTEQVDMLLRARLDALMREKQFGIAADAPPPLEDPEGPPPVQPQQPQQPVQAQPAQPVRPTQEPAQDLQSRALTVAGQSCVVCHNPKQAKGGLTLTNEQSQWAPVKDGIPMSNADVAAPVEQGRMPKISPALHTQPLTSQQRNDLIAWLKGQ